LQGSNVTQSAVFTAWHRIASVKLHHSLSHASGLPEFSPPNTDVAIRLVTPNCGS